MKSAIMFSGGIDSTLSAAITALDSEQVYLLSYNHCLIWQIEKTRKQWRKLEKRFPGKIFYRVFNVNEYFRKIYFTNIEEDYKKYKSLMFLMICAACKLAMHTKTIIFCLENNIDYAADGAYQKQNVFVAQMEKIILEMVTFYSNYKIGHGTPIYYYPDKSTVNRGLYELGVHNQKNYYIKWPMQTDAYLFADTQPTCLMGNPAGGFSKFIYAPVHGEKKRLKLSLDYFYEKSEIMKQIIKEHFISKNIKIEELVKDRILTNFKNKCAKENLGFLRK